MKKTKNILLLCLIVALTSQVYWNFLLQGFRVSASVVLLPVLLLTMTRAEAPAEVGGWLSLFIFGFRMLVELAAGSPPGEAMCAVLPGAMFYATYCLLFQLLVPELESDASLWLIPTLAFCDFAANCMETTLKTGVMVLGVDYAFFAGLVAVAVTRAVLAFAVLLGEGRYRKVLTGAQHEIRYQRLFLMKTSLKDEVYFMRKNSEEIETVMSSAYQLYEKLSESEMPEETQKLALTIARDVHEIKKDYFRIIQGIEQEIGDTREEEGMRMEDLLQILKDSTARMLQKKDLHIYLDFYCHDNLVTNQHYAMMSVLKNLVNNAIEAIETVRQSGTITVTERKVEETYCFSVQDDGCGIAPRDLSRIFRMGFSTKFDEKTGSIYRGVGLAGVKMTVEEQLGGTITVESAIGRGTTFELKVPAKILETATPSDLHA